MYINLQKTSFVQETARKKLQSEGTMDVGALTKSGHKIRTKESSGV